MHGRGRSDEDGISDEDGSDDEVGEIGCKGEGWGVDDNCVEAFNILRIHACGLLPVNLPLTFFNKMH